MKYILILILIPGLGIAQQKDYWIEHINVFPSNEELKFLNSIQDKLNSVVISNLPDIPVFEPWFTYEDPFKSEIKSILETAKPDSSYRISFITNEDYNQFSIVSISRNYLPSSPQNNSRIVFPSQAGIDNVDTLYRPTYAAESTPKFGVELVNYEKFLSISTYDSLNNLAFKLLLRTLSKSQKTNPNNNNNYIVNINAKKANLSYPNLNFVYQIHEALMNNEVNGYRNISDTIPCSADESDEVFFLNYDTIQHLENGNIINTFSSEINKFANIKFYNIVSKNDTHLKFQTLQSTICFSINYALIGFEFKLRIAKPNEPDFKTIWLNKKDLSALINNKYFDKYIDLIYYGNMYEIISK